MFNQMCVRFHVSLLLFNQLEVVHRNMFQCNAHGGIELNWISTGCWCTADFKELH